MPKTKNGPKGISDFHPFFPKNINPTPIIAPTEKERNKATKILGQPKNKPMKKASLTSPKPIHFSLEIKTSAKKNAEAPMAEKRGLTSCLKSVIRNP